jgi:hypothetical protein
MEKPILVLPAGADAGAALATAAPLALASLAAVPVDGDSLFEQPLNAAATHNSPAPAGAASELHPLNRAEFQAMSVSVIQIVSYQIPGVDVRGCAPTGQTRHTAHYGRLRRTPY